MDVGSDHNVSDLGITLLELMAYIADGLHYYVDRAANELYLPTAVSRQNVSNILRLIGYQMRRATAATVTLKFSTDVALISGNLRIPAGTRAQTASVDALGSVTFVTTEDAYILASSADASVTVSAVEGEPVTDPDATLSVPQAYMTLQLLRTPVVEGSVRVEVDETGGTTNFIEWLPVDSFLGYGPLDRVYVITTSASGVVSVTFGDNFQGKIPTSGSTVRASYRVGGGTRGNVGANTVTTVVDPILYAGSPVTVNVTNEASAVGGSAEESVNEAKVLGPRSLKAMQRAVTNEDYETWALMVPGVSKVQVVQADPHRTLRTACCTLSLYLVGEGCVAPNQALKDAVKTEINSRRGVCSFLDFPDPRFLSSRITGTVVVKANYQIASVEANFLAALRAYLSCDSDVIGIGKTVYMSDIFALMDGIEGVDYVDLAELTIDPVPDLIIWSGGAQFTSIVVGNDATREDIEVEFTSATDFVVRGGDSGLLGSGTIGAPFVSTRIEFMITNSGSPQAVGDLARITLSNKVGNIVLADGEVLIQGPTSLTFEHAVTTSRTRCAV